MLALVRLVTICLIAVPGVCLTHRSIRFGGIRIPIHEWSHVAVKFDGATETHYVNGILGETDSCPGGALAHHPVSSNSCTPTEHLPTLLLACRF